MTMNKSVYTAEQISKICDIPLHTLRYYVKIGLCPFVELNKSGHRRWQAKDIGWIKQLQALKRMGLTLAQIAQYVEWVKQGDATLNERLTLFLQQRDELLKGIAQLQNDLAFVEQKCAIYQNALDNPNDNATTGCLEMIEQVI